MLTRGVARATLQRAKSATFSGTREGKNLSQTYDCRHSRRLRILTIAGLGAIVAGVVATSGPGQLGAVLGARHLGRPQAISFNRDPDKQGGEGPVATAAQEQYDNRAYPNTTIDFAQVIASQQAYQAVKTHGKGKSNAAGSNSAGASPVAAAANTAPWTLIGPSSDQVSAFLSYTPGAGAGVVSSGRVTAIAVANDCSAASCRVWVGAAGGGVWTTGNGLAASPVWHASSDGLTSNSIGSIAIDPNDASGNTLYVGTGEPNGSSDSEAGVGLFKSTNRGASWSLVSGSVPVSKDRSIGAVLVDPSNASHLYIGTDVARHGLSSVAGGRFTPPGAPSLGVYESMDGGATWTHPLNPQPQDVVVPGTANGADFYRGGVQVLAFDPTDVTTVYAATFGYGVWRRAPTVESGDTSFKQVIAPSNPKDSTGERNGLAVASHTRVYVSQGGDKPAHLFRTDSADQPAATLTGATGRDGWQDLSSKTRGSAGFGSYNFCGGQCWYDQPLASPAGHPDTVWFGGSMQYSELFPGSPSNGRAVMRSTDGGVHFADMTDDAQSPPDWLHPDQHAIVFDPNNPEIAFIGNDGGVFRTSGSYTDSSSSCAARGVTGADLTDCLTWLSAIPTQLSGINSGLATLQFQSLSLNPQNANDLLGGTQDNGTLSYTGSDPSWFETINGDGGLSGIDLENSNIRIHTYFGPQADVNFHGTLTQGWDWVSDPLVFAPEASAFYIPVLTDPVRSGTIFVGLQHVWRTQDSGGPQAFLDAHCNEFGIAPFGSDQVFTGNCGDWQPIGGNLTSTTFGADKLGGWVAAIARPAHGNALWAGTRRGRLFISTNGNFPQAAAVSFTRIDTVAQPKRFVSGIAVDPKNPYHAFVSFSGYNAYTPTTPGHVFEVTFDPKTGTASWVDRSYDLGDQPITGVVLDSNTGDLYASTDFGVVELPNGSTSWVTAGSGLPPVAVYGLTVSSPAHVLYAATHGRSAYRLSLP